METQFTRPDGRGPKDLRDLKVEVGILKRANGSARVHLGKNLAIATIYGPREMHPKHASRADSAVVRINYRMATFSVDDYKRAYPSRREKEISKVLSEAFESVILTEKWPRSVLDIHVEMFQSDGGTRTAAAIAISAALADAGIPMRDTIAGIAAGIYDDEVVLDLTGHEDMKGTGDMPLLYSPATDEISLFQLDGHFTFEQFKEAFQIAIDGVKKISKEIQKATKEKYLDVRHEYIDEEEEEIDPSILDEDDDEVTPVPDEPVGEAHAVATADTSEDIGHTKTIEEPSESDEMIEEKEEEESIEEKPISNQWFTKSGGEVRPMSGDSETDQEDEEGEEEIEEEDDEEDNEEILRDLEYSFDQEE